MTLLLNNAEGGTNGAAVTVSSSGIGTGNSAFTAVSPVTAGAISFKASSAWRGNLGYSLVQATSANACTFEWADTASADFTARFYFRLNAFPSAQCQGPLNVRTSSAQLGRLNLQTTGAISTTIGTTNVTDGFSTALLAVGTWYRFEVTGTGFGTSSTSMVTRIYVGDATGTPFITTQVSGVTTVGPVTVARFGRNNAQGSNDWDFDNVALNIGSTTTIGPASAGDAGADQVVEPASSVALTGQDVGAWSQVSGPKVTLYDYGRLQAPAAAVAAWSSLWDALPISGPGMGSGGWLGGDGCWSVTHPSGTSALFTFGDSPVSRVQPVTLTGTSAGSQGTATDRLIIFTSQASQFAVGGRVQVFLTGNTTPRYGPSVTHTIASMNSASGYTNLNLTEALPSAPAATDTVKGATGGTDYAFPNSACILWTRASGLQLVSGMDPFIPNDPGQSATWYWAGPMITDSDGRLYVFPSKQVHDGSSAGYSVVARGLFRYDWSNPAAGPTSPVKLADMTGPIGWGAAACSDASWNYIFGTYRPNTSDFSFNLYLARVARGGLSGDPASTWQFWTPSGWLSGASLFTTPASLTALITSGSDGAQGVENTISAHNYGGSFKVSSKRGGVFGANVTIWDASTVTGPYTPRTIGAAPYGQPTSSDQTYLTNGHFNLPALGDGTLLVSVSRNRAGLSLADYRAGSAFYRPKWFSAVANGGTVAAPPVDPTNAATFKAPADLGQQVLTFAYGGTQMSVTVLGVTERVMRGGVVVPAVVYVNRP